MKMKTGDKISIEIIDISREGGGIGKFDGFTFFTDKGLPGDKVEAVIKQIKKNFGLAIVTRYIKKSQNRIASKCEQFESCGGCCFQEISYDAELDIKMGWVENTLKRIGGFTELNIDRIIGMNLPEYYRNKITLHKDEQGIGFYKDKTNTVIPMTECRIAEKQHVDIIKRLKKISHISDIIVRTNYKHYVMIIIETERCVDDEIIGAFDGIKELNISSLYINGKLIYGSSELIDKILGYEFLISPKSFFQVNRTQTEILYQTAINFAALTGNETIIDAYCGTGTIAVCMAKNAKRVIGIEIYEQAIIDAKRNAERNGFSNIEFIAGKSEEIIGKVTEHADVVILDPPRKGCDKELFDSTLKMQPKKIIYISCDMATLARDAKILCENGYMLMKIQPVDMFPRTTHVECVVLMSSSRY